MRRACDHVAGEGLVKPYSIFNIVWVWITLFRLSESIKSATNDRHTGGLGIGIASLICGYTGFIPIIGIVTSIAAIICL